MDQSSPVSIRTMEMVTAACLMVIGAVVMWDSARLGAGWIDGPQSGYFPFRIGLLILVSSGVVFVLALLKGTRRPFVEREPLRQVLKVLLPTIVYGGVIAILGIYMASALFIAYFMLRLGDHRLITTAGVSVGVPLVLFMLFEVWFLVALPKGPVEALFGY